MYNALQVNLSGTSADCVSTASEAQVCACRRPAVLTKAGVDGFAERENKQTNRTCRSCGSVLMVRREEAYLDLEVRGPDVPRLFLDVTVRHSVPGCRQRLARSATHNGSVNMEAEQDK